MSERWQRLVDAAKNGAKEEIRYQIDGMIGSSPLGDLQQNRSAPEEDEETDIEVENPDDDDLPSFHFDDKENDNLASAAAAYRMLGAKGDIVATHGPTKGAFFGTPGQLESFIGHRQDLDDQWTLYEDPDEILELDYDQITMKEILHQLNDKNDAEALASAEDLFKKFHWGDKSKTVAVKTVPGVEGPLTFLGVGREVHYGAKKDGKWVEYFHEFGEDSKTFPGIYAFGDDVLVIHGGKMRVEKDGIID